MVIKYTVKKQPLSHLIFNIINRQKMRHTVTIIGAQYGSFYYHFLKYIDIKFITNNNNLKKKHSLPYYITSLS